MNIKRVSSFKGFFNKDEYIGKQNIILFISIAVHLVFFIANLFIGGYYCDEVMTAFNAKCLVTGGTDIMGERLPVYFDTWLYGGQSPMATYLTALSIKIFGMSHFAYRFPIFVFGIIGLFALRSFLNEIFIKNKTVSTENNKYVFTILILAAFSPWHIFSSTYMMDCNFLPHFMIIGMMFLAKAVNSYSCKKYYILSMIFFGLCFYCYIASVLIIPVFLTVFFLILFIKKKIPLKCIISSVVTVFVVSIPFILFGLVAVGAVKPFSLLGFSFSDMPYYSRASSLTFTQDFFSALKESMYYLFSSMAILSCPDILAPYTGELMFVYTNFIGGIIMLFGLLIFIVSLIKKRLGISFNFKLILLCSISAVLFFSFFSDSGRTGVAYRFGSLFYLLIIIEGFGFVEIAKIFKKLNYKRFFAAFMVISFSMFAAEFSTLYASGVNTKGTVYGDSLYDCISFIEKECKTDEYTVAVSLSYDSSLSNNEQQTVYLLDYYYGKKELSEPEKLFKSVGYVAAENDFKDPVPNITADNSIKYQDICKNPTITDNVNIVCSKWIKDLSIDKSKYSVKDFGVWSVIYCK